MKYKIDDIMKQQYGKCPGDYVRQKKIVDNLKHKLDIEKRKLFEIELWDRAEYAMAVCQNIFRR